MGMAGIALQAMLRPEGEARGAEFAATRQPKAKNVIWIFLVGGMSHMESFDPKPELNKHAGKTIAESPYKQLLDSPYLKKNLREFVAGQHKVQPTIYPLQVGYGQRGQSGLEMSDWWPHLGECADDFALVRSMWMYRQRSRRPAAISYRAARDRRAVPHDRLVGALGARLAQR